MADIERAKNGEFENSIDVTNNVSSSIENLTDKTKDAEVGLQQLNRSANTMSAAFQEMNDKKELSVDTTLALIKAGYAAILEIDDETRAVRINAEAYRDLAKAKLESQQASYATQIAEFKSQRINAESGISSHNWRESQATIGNIDSQIKALELQMNATGQISNNLDMVVAGRYHSAGEAAYQREQERLARQSAGTSLSAGRSSAGGNSGGGFAGVSGGNLISITSYIPTIWDDVETANEKLKKGLGASIVGSSSTGKLVTGLETIADNAGSIGVPTARLIESKEANLNDVISAINDLKDSPVPKQPLNINLLANRGVIGWAAIDDINEITERNGISPLIG
jgi:hypothetical protein